MRTTTVENDKPQDAFAGSRYKTGVREARSSRRGKKRTFAMDPQEGRGPLPLFEYTALEKPGCRSLVVSLACNIMVRRGIGGREPILKFLS
jgi:hypothetical protein